MVSVDVKHHVCLLTVKQSPGEIKRREVSWTLRKSWTIGCGSRRDQEEGGALDSQEELDNNLRVQARSKGGRCAGLSGRIGL